MKQSIIATTLGVLLASGCALEDEALQPPTTELSDDTVVSLRAGELDVVASSTATLTYGSWITLAKYNPYASVSWRACKTSTRIYWQFTGNYSFNKVHTYGSSISLMTSDIGGQVSGSKYRTRNNTATFGVWFQGLAGELWNEHRISNIPNC
ncbi:MAG: hypothetical protein R3B48_07630 [Kofleriaceae bacterium]